MRRTVRKRSWRFKGVDAEFTHDRGTSDHGTNVSLSMVMNPDPRQW